MESDEDSSEEDMEEDGTEGERNTGEDDAGSSHTDGSQSRKRNRKPTKIGTIRQEPKCHSDGYVRQVASILRTLSRSPRLT